MVRPGQVRPGASGASNVIYSNALPPGGQGPRVAQVPGGPRGVGASMRMTGTTATKIGGGVTGPRMVQRPLLGRPPGQNSVTSVQKLPHGVSPTGKVAPMNSLGQARGYGRITHFLPLPTWGHDFPWAIVTQPVGIFQTLGCHMKDMHIIFP